jgi:hypothetical protein
VATSSSNRQNGLRWAGLIVGLAGVVWFLLLGTGVIWGGEGGLSWGALFPGLVVYVIPLLVGILIAWKWPLIGGILLIAEGLFWVVFVLIIEPSMSLLDVLRGLAYMILGVSLPMLVSGTPFLLSRKRE